MGDPATAQLTPHHDRGPLDLVDVPLFGPYARWLRRVVAALLDGALLTGVTFLAVGPVAAPGILPFVQPGRNIPFRSVDGLAWQDSGWVVGTIVALVLLQAYTGATPGKRTVGISVVDRDTGRPVGLVTTVLRWLAHLLDAILLIGYLRPLWDARRRTFADSLLSTIVVRTRYPAPWSPRGWPTGAMGPGPAVAWWDRSRARAWSITATATALCLVGVGLSVSSTVHVLPLAASSTCAVTRVSPSSGGLTGFGASVDVWGQGQDTRLGVSRATAPSPGSSSISVDLAGSTEGHVSVAASVLRQDGTRAWAAEEALGALSTADPLPSQVVSFQLPDDLSARLGTTWTWEVLLLEDGRVVESCTGDAPVLG